MTKDYKAGYQQAIKDCQKVMEKYYPELLRKVLNIEHLMPVYQIWKELENKHGQK